MVAARPSGQDFTCSTYITAARSDEIGHQKKDTQMRSMTRYLLLALAMCLYPLVPSQAQVSVGIGLPNVSIGVNFAAYPELVPIPGYPVYYDPRANYNYFFYDGLYWAYWNDNWYASSWYNGPWQLVDPYNVPLFVLRVPVRYYHVRPAYFYGWALDAAPHWGEHWGRSWEQRRVGWDRWNRSSAPAPAPLPLYQRQYSGDRYPRAVAQQQTIRAQNYHYQPREAVARQAFQQQGAPNDQRRARAEPQQQTPVQQQRPTQQSRAVQNQQSQDQRHARAEPQQHAPVPQQRPTEQSRAVQNQQSQAIQAERAQASRERQAVQSEQMHRGPPSGHPQGSPQANAESRAAAQGQGRGQGQAQGRGPAQENHAAAQPQSRIVENRGAPQGQENRGGHQEHAAENKGSRQGNVKEDKKE
jgi:hypothetical protein